MAGQTFCASFRKRLLKSRSMIGSHMTHIETRPTRGPRLDLTCVLPFNNEYLFKVSTTACLLSNIPARDPTTSNVDSELASTQSFTMCGTENGTTGAAPHPVQNGHTPTSVYSQAQDYLSNTGRYK